MNLKNNNKENQPDTKDYTIYVEVRNRENESVLEIREVSEISVGEDVEKREALCTFGGNVNCCSYYRKQYGSSRKN